MVNEEPHTLFERVVAETRSQVYLGLEELQDTMIQDREIRELAEIIRESMPVTEPLLYSSA